jgi:DNA-binding CsgD family transcriptional regulator
MRKRDLSSRQQPSDPKQRQSARRPSEPAKAAEELGFEGHNCADDLRNILDSSKIATVLLDRQLNIQFISTAAGAAMNLKPHDIGLPFSVLADRFAVADLLADARSVLECSAPFKRRIVHVLGGCYLCSITAYREDDRIEGVVISLCDMSGLETHQGPLTVDSPLGKEAARISKLTPRQHKVMDLVVAGLASKEIAFRLGINQRTVETHRATIMKKVGARSLADLIRLHIAAEGG